ncbi:MAG: PP0621 family protein [Nitrosomonas sp.]
MGKILVLIIIAGLIFWMFRINLNKKYEPADSSRPFEDMVSCAHCGIHVPKNESLSDQNNQHFCCIQHREEFKKS